MRHKGERLIGVVLLMLLAVAACSFLVVFDVTTAAQKFDEEYNGTRLVALGPRPRHIFCRPTYDIHYAGDEWVFRVFKPFCVLWRTVMGYAPPKKTPSEIEKTVSMLEQPTAGQWWFLSPSAIEVAHIMRSSVDMNAYILAFPSKDEVFVGGNLEKVKVMSQQEIKGNL